MNDVTARDLPQRRPQWFRDKSLALTLRPGDVIATGIPEGVGVASGRFLRPGGRVEAEVERIGVLANPVVAP